MKARHILLAGFAANLVMLFGPVYAHAQQAEQDGVRASAYMSESRPNYGSDPIVQYQNNNGYRVKVGVAVQYRCAGEIQNGTDETILQAHSDSKGLIVGGCEKDGDDVLSVRITFVSNLDQSN